MEFLVKPTVTQTSRTIKLSTADQYVPKQWLPRVLFFPMTGSQTKQAVFANLKDGLSRTLSQLPVLVGRIVRQADKDWFASVEITEDSGVDFLFKDHTAQNGEEVSKNSTFPTYATLKQNNFPMENFAAWGAPKVLFCPVTEGSSLFVAQANFVKGGLALLFGVAHLTVDAAAWATIVRLWAQNTSAAAKGEPAPNSTELDFTKIRQDLSVGTPSINPSEWSDPIWTVGDIANSPCNLSKPIPPEQQTTLAQRFGQPTARGQTDSVKKSSWRIWYLTPEKLKAVKLAGSSPDTKQWISTMDAVFALFWQRSAIYRNFGASNHQTSIAREPIDLRTRMQIDPNFVGNAVSVLETRCLVSELEHTDETIALPAIAQKLRATIQSFTMSMTRDFIGVANSLPREKGIHHPSPSFMAPNMLLNDHSKLQVYGFDWGNGLEPLERVRGPEPDFPVRNLGLVVAFPTLPDGGLEVASVFDDDVNDALEKDKTFMKYVESRY